MRDVKEYMNIFLSRPLVWSLILSHLPIIILPHNEDTTRVLCVVLIITGTNHHMFFKIGDFWHNADRVTCYTLIVATFFTNLFSYHSFIYYICLLMIGICHLLNLRSYNKDVELRTWKNLTNLKWHVLMHMFSGIGMLSMVLYRIPRTPRVMNIVNSFDMFPK